MSGHVWDKVSKHAKDLVRNLLQYDPKERYTVKQALSHDWFVLDNQALQAEISRRNSLMQTRKSIADQSIILSKTEIQNALANLKTFKVTQKLKQATFAFIVAHLLTKNEK